MSWIHLEDETIVVPQFQVKTVQVIRKDPNFGTYAMEALRSTKEPTGNYERSELFSLALR